jgi:hypothetical protein
MRALNPALKWRIKMNGKMVKLCSNCKQEEYTTYEIENMGICSYCGYSGGGITLSNSQRIDVNGKGVFVPLE